MFRRSLQTVLVLVLATSPALSAATTPWSGIMDVFHWAGLAIQVKEGCSINPNGQPCPKRSRHERRPPSPKAGCSIDPGGKLVCVP